MHRALALVALVAFVAAPVAASEIKYKQMFGVWKRETPPLESDTIKLMRRHRYQREIISYAPGETSEAGSQVEAIRSETKRIVDKGTWHVEDNLIFLIYYRTIDGERQPFVFNGNESGHFATMVGTRDRIQILSHDGIILYNADREIFERVAAD